MASNGLRIMIIAVALLLGVAGLPRPIKAQSATSPIRIVVNGQLLVLQQVPVLRNGHLLVPFKEILPSFELHGSVVERELHAFPRKGRFPAVTLHLGDREAWITPGMRDCRETRLDVAPVVITGHTMVPLRFLAEAVGIAVRWESGTKPALLDFAPGAPRTPIHLPKPVPAVPVHGTWTVKYNHPLGCAACAAFPFSVRLSAINPVPRGAPAYVTVAMYNISRRALVLPEPVTLRVRIARDFGCPVIWEGLLPPLTGPASWGAVELRFAWDKRDAYGRPVLPGDYLAEIAVPMTIPYTRDGTSSEERLTDTSHSVISGELDYAGITIE